MHSFVRFLESDCLFCAERDLTCVGGCWGLATVQFTPKVKNYCKQNDYTVRKSQAPRRALHDFYLYQYQRGCLPCLFGGLHLPVRFAVVMPYRSSAPSSKDFLLLREPFSLGVLDTILRCRAGLLQCSGSALLCKLQMMACLILPLFHCLLALPPLLRPY